MLGDAGGVYFFECRQLPGASGQGALRLLLSTRAPAVAGPESPSDPPAGEHLVPDVVAVGPGPQPAAERCGGVPQSVVRALAPVGVPAVGVVEQYGMTDRGRRDVPLHRAAATGEEEPRGGQAGCAVSLVDVHRARPVGQVPRRPVPPGQGGESAVGAEAAVGDLRVDAAQEPGQSAADPAFRLVDIGASSSESVGRRRVMAGPGGRGPPRGGVRTAWRSRRRGSRRGFRRRTPGSFRRPDWLRSRPGPHAPVPGRGRRPG